MPAGGKLRVSQAKRSITGIRRLLDRKEQGIGGHVTSNDVQYVLLPVTTAPAA